MLPGVGEDLKDRPCPFCRRPFAGSGKFCLVCLPDRMAAEQAKAGGQDDLVLVETRPDWTRWVPRSELRPEWKIIKSEA